MARPGLLAAAGAGAATLALPGVLRAAEMKDYILATANTGGTFYPIGVAVATLTQLKLANQKGIRLNAINSAGSGENIYLLSRSEVQFALMQSVFGYFAATGTGPAASLGPQKDLRTISMMWRNVEHPVLRSSLAKSGTMADMDVLKGHIRAGTRRRFWACPLCLES
ncbi:immunogenic protein [Citreicella sp. SE45]|nr:immunogenic protein [Citreicella sp. SE45]